MLNLNTLIKESVEVPSNTREDLIKKVILKRYKKDHDYGGVYYSWNLEIQEYSLCCASILTKILLETFHELHPCLGDLQMNDQNFKPQKPKPI
jgi:hypothetical protein